MQRVRIYVAMAFLVTSVSTGSGAFAATPPYDDHYQATQLSLGLSGSRTASANASKTTGAIAVSVTAQTNSPVGIDVPFDSMKGVGYEAATAYAQVSKNFFVTGTTSAAISTSVNLTSLTKPTSSSSTINVTPHESAAVAGGRLILSAFFYDQTPACLASSFSCANSSGYADKDLSTLTGTGTQSLSIPSLSIAPGKFGTVSVAVALQATAQSWGRSASAYCGAGGTVTAINLT